MHSFKRNLIACKYTDGFENIVCKNINFNQNYYLNIQSKSRITKNKHKQGKKKKKDLSYSKGICNPFQRNVGQRKINRYTLNSVFKQVCYKQ